ncbi:ABC transporter ATP-binding protein [Dactylosporangium sp. NPDC005572]|uniref:ABC transporter ATP-binding protein n=1 Tax=Dactylosporangium sp. NPDC005572 TaxID=3156889 RepID=UPI0033A7E069
MPTETAAILAEGVRRDFGAVSGLGPLDLTIDDGEFVCVVGPSGCGKSTFLRIVAGILRPTAGEVTIATRGDGKVPLSMVFQDHGIYPWKTVEQNVRFALEVNGFGRAEARRRTDHWLGQLGLAEFRTAYPSTLSGGMRQRVGIARAFALDPEILLMDEPFAALDAQLRQVLQEELLGLWQRDRRTVVFVTHSLEEAILLGDRVVVMSARPGRVVRSTEVPFERPRAAAVRDSAAFADLKAQLWDCLRHEVDAYLATVTGGTDA